MQTDTEAFFKYIFEFLGELERRITSGEISVDDILQAGREALNEEIYAEQNSGTHGHGKH